MTQTGKVVAVVPLLVRRTVQKNIAQKMAFQVVAGNIDGRTLATGKITEEDQHLFVLSVDVNKREKPLASNVKLEPIKT